MGSGFTVAPARFRGELLAQGDEGYEGARAIRNQRVQGTPAIVARCRCAMDVIDALGIARNDGLEVSVRGGGHSVGGWSSNDGGLVIDLTLMRWVLVDPQARTAWIGGGTQAGDLLVEAGRFGLAAVTGIEPSIGVAGLTMGIGEGYLTPRLGYGADHLLAFELVTAEGKVMQVSADQHPDLFWAMRGAGPNFGVVTAIKVQLHQAPEHAVGGWITFDGAAAESVTEQIWQTMKSGSEYFSPLFLFQVGSSGRLEIKMLPGHTGSPAMAENEIDAFCEQLAPIADERRAGSYLEMIFQEAEWGEREDWDLLRFPFDREPEQQRRVLLDQVRRGGPEGMTPERQIVLWRSVAPPAPASASAVPRLQGITLNPLALWQDKAADSRELDWMHRTSAAFRASGVVEEAANAINHVSSTDEAQVRGVYGSATYERLAKLKAEYDPQNVFHRNFNVQPAIP